MTVPPKQPSRLAFLPYVVVYICFMAAILLAAHFLPGKFATYLPNGGVSLLRDDQELSVYHDRAAYVYQHMAPYAYSRIEYPLLGALYIAIPALFASGQGGFSLGFMVLNTCAGALLLFVTYRLLVWFGRPASLVWLFLIPGMAYFTLNRFDILPALLAQASLLLLFKKRWDWAFFVLGLSVLAKGYAILLFPIFFTYWLVQTGRAKSSLWNNRALWVTAGTVAAGLLLSVILAGWQDGIFPYYFQSTRSFAFGSIYTIFIVGIWNSEGVGFVTTLMSIATKILILLQFVLPALIYGGYAVFRRFIRTPENVVNWSIIVILVYVLFSPYYSPQWLLWLVPMLLIWRPVRLAALLAAAYGVIAYLEYPVAINMFGFSSTNYNMLVLVRTVLLVGVLIIVLQQIRTFIGKDERVVPTVG